MQVSSLRGIGGVRYTVTGSASRRLACHEELRRSLAAAQLATGTLACPSCDAPVVLAGPWQPAAPLSCPFCATSGPLRRFLVLGEPTRPTRVVVRVGVRS